MALPNINPTKTEAWKKLSDHFKDNKDINIKNLFKEAYRKEAFSVQLNDLNVDFSKNYSY